MRVVTAQATNTSPLLPGLAAIVCFAAYGWQSVHEKLPGNILWACHVGCLLVGIGWLAGSPLANAIGVLWLLPGVVLWTMYLVAGGVFKVPSLLTHVGGSALGLWGVLVLGFPAGTWWKAGLGWAALMALSRAVPAPGENVNFSRQVWPGWETRFPSYGRYVAFNLAGGFVVFLGLEWAFQRLLAATG